MLKYKIPQIVTLTRSSFSALLNYMRIPTKKLLTPNIGFGKVRSMLGSIIKRRS